MYSQRFRHIFLGVADMFAQLQTEGDSEGVKWAAEVLIGLSQRCVRDVMAVPEGKQITVN